MSANINQYREHLYRMRAHPTSQIPTDFVDNRDSFFIVYLSVIPFVLLEYYAEKTAWVPSALIFPVGYLLFWAFYYTYYRPGFLEDKLTSPSKWDWMAIPTILVGVAIWFVKITVVEFSGFFLKHFFGINREATKKREAAKAASRARKWQEQKAQARKTWGSERSSPPPRYANPPPGTKAPSRSTLPSDLVQALSILGLNANADWSIIHRRYRELAKQYHPDLNKEITDVGRRFMIFDAAYKKLASQRNRYFSEKRQTG